MLAFSFSPLFNDLLGLVYPLARSWSGKQIEGKVIERDGADAARNKRKLVRNWVCHPQSPAFKEKLTLITGFSGEMSAPQSQIETSQALADSRL